MKALYNVSSNHMVNSHDYKQRGFHQPKLHSSVSDFAHRSVIQLEVQ